MPHGGETLLPVQPSEISRDYAGHWLIPAIGRDVRYLMLQLALAIGMDPFTFLVLGMLAGTCAWFMKEMMPNPWMAFAFYPVLLGCAVLTVAAATSLEVIPAIEVRIDADGEMAASDWGEAIDNLPPVVMVGIVGMSMAAVAIIGAVRKLHRFV